MNYYGESINLKNEKIHKYSNGFVGKYCLFTI